MPSVCLTTNTPVYTCAHCAAGVGDKHVLREALRQLGLPEAARRDKRAIQFGSRIGRLTNVRDFGSSRAANK